MFAALAVSRWRERQTGWSIKKLVQPSAATAASRSARASTFSTPGDRWQETGLVFTTAFGTAMDAPTSGVTFRRALHLVPGIDPGDWTPGELRHSFVSLLSDAGVPPEEISRLVGHSGTTVTELCTGTSSSPCSRRDRDGLAVQAED
jgi:integrase